MQLLEKVAFTRVECRLAERLLTLSDTENPLHLTQSDLATQIGTAREVVSRRLENWSRRGWVRTGRGTIEVLDPDALHAVASDAM
jgi:CRP/FNR family transcriptional regulator